MRPLRTIARSTKTTDRWFLLALLVLPLVTPAPARGDIQWERTAAEIAVGPAEPQAEISFRFSNVGNKPVTIKRVLASCGCVTTTAQLRAYAPGERGVVTVTMVFGSQTGKIVRNIYVQTQDERGDHDVALKVTATVPSLVQVDPGAVSWMAGDEPRPKAVTITAQQGVRLRVTAAKASHPAIKVSTRLVERWQRYALVVQTLSTEGTLHTNVEVEAEVEMVGLPQMGVLKKTIMVPVAVE